MKQRFTYQLTIDFDPNAFVPDGDQNKLNLLYQIFKNEMPTKEGFMTDAMKAAIENYVVGPAEGSVATIMFKSQKELKETRRRKSKNADASNA